MVLLSNSFLKKVSNKFDYNNAKEIAIKYLNQNEYELKRIVDELYESKSSMKMPYEGIRYAAYNCFNDFDFKLETEYIQFDLDAQGTLGGQYYGLIYSEVNTEDLIVYDEYKETRSGNNIFIRKKIKDHWYFYYNDFDGNISTNGI